jgi:hypothetical protein
MKHLFSVTLLFSLALGATVHAEPVKVRIQTTDNKIHIGSITGQSGGSVQFVAAASAEPRLIPAGQITSVKFSMKERDEEEIKRLHETGEYREIYPRISEILQPFRPYVNLPSNLAQNYLYWMESAYWANDYGLVQQLAGGLRQSRDPEVQKHNFFYIGLMLLESGTDAAVEALMARPSIDTIYPPGSAVRFYVDACVLNRRGEFLKAVRTAARLTAVHSRDVDWMPKAELLCAELYFKLDMPESAQAVLADIKQFYTDPNIQKKAAAIAAQNEMEKK